MITTTVKYRQIGSIGQGISSKDDSSIVTELLDEESFYMNIYNTDANAAVGIATTSLIEDPGDFEFQVSPGGQDFISLGEDANTFNRFGNRGSLDSSNGITVCGAEFSGKIRMVMAYDHLESASQPYDSSSLYGWEEVIDGENTGDYFGSAVAYKHNRIVIGARIFNSGVGKVYIMDCRGRTLKTLQESGTGNYGTTVAIGCGRILVGANNTTVNSQSSFGCVYMYDMDGNFIRKIIPTSGGSSGDRFGDDVAIGEGRIVVGARWDNTEDGSIYIFDLNGKQLQKINSPDGTGAQDGSGGTSSTRTGDDFGCSISIGDGRIVVGACHSKIPPGRYTGGSIVRVGASQGIVYIYDLDGNLLKKIAMATDSDHSSYKSTSYSYGYHVNVMNGRIFVGDPDTEDTYLSTTLDTRGALYMYDLDGNLLKRYLVRQITGGGDFSDNFASYGSSTTMEYFRSSGRLRADLMVGLGGLDYDTESPDPANTELEGRLVNQNTQLNLGGGKFTPFLTQTHYLESMEMS